MTHRLLKDWQFENFSNTTSIAQKHVETAGVPRGSNSLFSQTAGVPRGMFLWTTGVPRGSKFFGSLFVRTFDLCRLNVLINK